MNLDWPNVYESLTRWLHVVAGILWIGLLYFFNWVNGSFAATLDAESKRKVVPQLMPRALFWFRWGAAWTWISGVALLKLVYYGPKLIPEWDMVAIVSTALILAAPFIYDILLKTVLTTNQLAFIGGLIAFGGLGAWYDYAPSLSYRVALIHIGATFGTIMAFNVWFRIWPAQRKIITAIRDGQAPDGALVKLAGTRSKHNTYMSVPLVFAMVGQHGTWGAETYWAIPVIILIGWTATYLIYKKSATVPGF